MRADLAGAQADASRLGRAVRRLCSEALAAFGMALLVLGRVAADDLHAVMYARRRSTAEMAVTTYASAVCCSASLACWPVSPWGPRSVSLVTLAVIAGLVSIYVLTYVPRLERGEAGELAARRATRAAARAARASKEAIREP